MYPLRYAPFWLTIGAFLIGLVIYGSLATGGPPVDITISDKVIHLLTYTILMFWFGGIFQQSSHWWVLTGLFLLGVSLEILQAQGQVRVYENWDIVMNGLGLVIGKMVCQLGLSGWCQTIESVVTGNFQK